MVRFLELYISSPSKSSAMTPFCLFWLTIAQRNQIALTLTFLAWLLRMIKLNRENRIQASQWLLFLPNFSIFYDIIRSDCPRKYEWSQFRFSILDLTFYLFAHWSCQSVQITPCAHTETNSRIWHCSNNSMKSVYKYRIGNKKYKLLTTHEINKNTERNWLWDLMQYQQVMRKDSLRVCSEGNIAFMWRYRVRKNLFCKPIPPHLIHFKLYKYISLAKFGSRSKHEEDKKL